MIIDELKEIHPSGEPKKVREMRFVGVQFWPHYKYIRRLMKGSPKGFSFVYLGTPFRFFSNKFQNEREGIFMTFMMGPKDMTVTRQTKEIIEKHLPSVNLEKESKTAVENWGKNAKSK